VTILGGLLPSLLASVAFLASAIYLWYFAGLCLENTSPDLGAWIFFALSIYRFLDSEFKQSTGVAIRSGFSGIVCYAALALLAAISIGLLWSFLGRREISNLLPDFAKTDPEAIAQSGVRFHASFAPAIVLTCVGTMLIFLRVLLSRLTPELSRIASKDTSFSWSEPMDRLIARCFRPAAIWTVFAISWEIAAWISGGNNGTSMTGVLAVGAGALFAVVRDWLSKPDDKTHASSIWNLLLKKAKPVLPQILAAVAVISMYEMVCIGVQKAGLGATAIEGCSIAIAILILTCVLFNPAMVGMHDFYRARICRCFLGASHANVGNFERDTDENPEDDLTLSELDGLRGKHLHLICCTANNIEGDPLGNLYRGSRSAVVSRFGIALGNRFAEMDRLRYSSALTASAAAFNSQMGRYSMRYGPAVAFLMSSLNLRLGLWVKHPQDANREYRVFPGLPFFLEMIGYTNCDPIRAKKPTAPRTLGASQPDPTPASSQEKKYRNLHLSDGGHFENLGLYELVRRHCRYIVVSDCGADQQVVFGDLAVALRTIREDFGVEVELDVSPLRPGMDGHARQHGVVGTIHYNGRGGADKGTLLFFKPSLTGDEPADIAQYQASHPAFPHEPTSDQFYDEAQWESYRCLGEHAAECTLAFVDNFRFDLNDRSRFLENTFLEANRFLRLPPERSSEELLALSQRCSEFDADVRDKAPDVLRSEFLPEVAASFNSGADHDYGRRTEIQAIYFLMGATQLMEDIWKCARLDAYGAHPTNDGWMNYLYRWTSTSSFRRWWPIINPLYSLGFREFIRDRFGISYHDPNREMSSGARLDIKENSGKVVGLAWDEWRRREPEMNAYADKNSRLEFYLTLDTGTNGPALEPLQVGILFFDRDNSNGKKLIRWKATEYFVPRSFSGSGISGRFLEAVIKWFGGKAEALDVIFARDIEQLNPARRQERIHDINFYRSRSFADANDPASLRLRRLLPEEPNVG